MKRGHLFILALAAAASGCSDSVDGRCDRPGSVSPDAAEIDVCVRLVESFSWSDTGGRVGAELDCEQGCELGMSLRAESGAAMVFPRDAWQPAMTLGRAEIANPGARRLLLNLRDESGQNAHTSEELAWMSQALERPQRQQILRVGNQYLELKLQSLERY